MAWLLGACLLASPASSSSAAELEAESVLAGVQEWLDGTHDLRARFEQSLVSGALGSGLEESGTLAIERPGKLRWDYLEPEKKIAILIGDRTWLYIEEDAELIRGRLDDETDLLPALLAGEGRLGEGFTAGLLATPKHGGEGSYRLRLVPLDASDAFEQIVVTTRPPEFAVEEVEVLDAVGNRVRYRFTRRRRNRGLAAGVFVFEPPPGTRILGQP